MRDPRNSIVKRIDLKQSRVLITKAPLIFLCGGKVGTVYDPPLSIRDSFQRYMVLNHPNLADSLLQVEEYLLDLHNDYVYDELHTFENHLGCISTLIILIPESPGSFAELGMFAEIAEIKTKLMVFVEEQHYNNESSYVRKGPLKLIEIHNDERVLPYSLGKLSGDEFEEVNYEDMKSDIDRELASLNQSTVYKLENSGHAAILIYSLILYFKALKLAEIQNYLELKGLSLGKVLLNQLLFLLRKFEFIDCRKYGGITYYYPVSDEQRLEFSGGVSLVDTSIEVMDYYRANKKEKLRNAFIKNLAKSADGMVE